MDRRGTTRARATAAASAIRSSGAAIDTRVNAFAGVGTVDLDGFDSELLAQTTPDDVLAVILLHRSRIAADGPRRLLKAHDGRPVHAIYASGKGRTVRR